MHERVLEERKAAPRAVLALLLSVCCVGTRAAGAPTIRDPAHGERLYATHCVTCHTTKMHWREKKLASDWTSLRTQVQRWQGLAGLEWSRSDIEDVTRYLNVLYYHYAIPADQGRAPDAAPGLSAPAG